MLLTELANLLFNGEISVEYIRLNYGYSVLTLVLNIIEREMGT